MFGCVYAPYVLQVGSVTVVGKEGDVLGKGACNGFFSFGGSTVLLLFQVRGSARRVGYPDGYVALAPHESCAGGCYCNRRRHRDQLSVRPRDACARGRENCRGSPRRRARALCRVLWSLFGVIYRLTLAIEHMHDSMDSEGGSRGLLHTRICKVKLVTHPIGWVLYHRDCWSHYIIKFMRSATVWRAARRCQF